MHREGHDLYSLFFPLSSVRVHTFFSFFFFPEAEQGEKRQEGGRESWVTEGSLHGPVTRWGFEQLASEEPKNFWKFPEPRSSPGCRLTRDGREREAEKAERTPLSLDLAPRATPLSSTANFQNTALACPLPALLILKSG